MLCWSSTEPIMIREAITWCFRITTVNLLKKEHVQHGTHPYVCGHLWTQACMDPWYFTFCMHVIWLNSPRNYETSPQAPWSNTTHLCKVKHAFILYFKENAHKARICFTLLLSIANRHLEIFYLINNELAFWYKTDSPLSLFFNFYWWSGVEREEPNENHHLSKTACLLFLLMAMHEQNNQLYLWCDPSQSIS